MYSAARTAKAQTRRRISAFRINAAFRSWVPSGDVTVSEASLRDAGSDKVTERLPIDKVAFMPCSRTVGVTATGR